MRGLPREWASQGRFMQSMGGDPTEKRLHVRGVTLALWFFLCRGHQVRGCEGKKRVGPGSVALLLPKVRREVDELWGADGPASHEPCGVHIESVKG